MTAAEARPHHDNFAHTQLRRAARDAPGELMRVLASPGARTYLVTLWNAIGDSLPEEYRVAAAGLRVRVVDLDVHRRLAMVVLPPPEHATEAHMVGIVLEPRRRLFGILPRRSHVRYFVLERAEGESKTALCEWPAAESDRVHLGAGPAPSEQAFREAIEARLAAS
jgi:hypothetical protein